MVLLKNGTQTVSVNPAMVRYVRPSWSSSPTWPRSVVVFGPERNGFFLPLWFFFPDPTITVDGTVEAVTEALQGAAIEDPHESDRPF